MVSTHISMSTASAMGVAEGLPRDSKPRATMLHIKNVSSSMTWTMQNGVSLTNAKRRAAPSLRFTEAHFVQSTKERLKSTET